VKAELICTASLFVVSVPAPLPASMPLYLKCQCP